MRLRIIKASHVDWIKREPGSVVEVDAVCGASLIASGLAVEAAEDAPIETTTLGDNVETAESPARGRGRRK